jgi:hypothetical protein
MFASLQESSRNGDLPHKTAGSGEIWDDIE